MLVPHLPHVDQVSRVPHICEQEFILPMAGPSVYYEFKCFLLTRPAWHNPAICSLVRNWTDFVSNH